MCILVDVTDRFYAKEISHELPELEIESNISDEDKQHTGVLRLPVATAWENCNPSEKPVYSV